MKNNTISEAVVVAPQISNTPSNSLPEEESEDDGSIDTNSGYELSTFEQMNDVHIAADFIEKLHALKYNLEADLMACDAKWTLFVAAALSYRYDSHLRPFPDKFVSEKGYNIDGLVSIINETPSLKVLLQNIIDEDFDGLDTEVIDLLNWVLVEMSDPLLRTVDINEFKNVVVPLLTRREAKHTKPTHVFEVCPSVESDLEELFQSAARKMDSRMAFYGDKLDSFFSIISVGFQQLLQIGNGDGGLTLCTELATVIGRSPNGAGWGASACGSMISCVALCEYINDDDFVVRNTNSKITHVHVAKHDLVRVRYLLFYGSRFPDESSLKYILTSWISRHKYALSLACYAVCLATIGISHSSNGQYLKHVINKKAQHLFNFCRRIFVADT